MDYDTEFGGDDVREIPWDGMASNGWLQSQYTSILCAIRSTIWYSFKRLHHNAVPTRLLQHTTPQSYPTIPILSHALYLYNSVHLLTAQFQADEISQADTWVVISAFFEEHALVSQQLLSFNDFVFETLGQVLWLFYLWIVPCSSLCFFSTWRKIFFGLKHFILFLQIIESTPPIQISRQNQYLPGQEDSPNVSTFHLQHATQSPLTTPVSLLTFDPRLNMKSNSEKSLLLDQKSEKMTELPQLSIPTRRDYVVWREWNSK